MRFQRLQQIRISFLLQPIAHIIQTMIDELQVCFTPKREPPFLPVDQTVRIFLDSQFKLSELNSPVHQSNDIHIIRSISVIGTVAGSLILFSNLVSLRAEHLNVENEVSST